MFSNPASICFNAPKDVFVSGLIVGSSFAWLACAFGEPIILSCTAAIVMAAVLRKRRRSLLIPSDIISSNEIRSVEVNTGPSYPRWCASIAELDGEVVMPGTAFLKNRCLIHTQE
jgi:hypothetical protein